MRKLEDLLGKALPHKEVLQAAKADIFLKDWPRLVGSELAARSRVLLYDHGLIIVQVTGSAWAQEINLRTPEILERLNRKGREAGLKDDTFTGIRVSIATSLKPYEERQGG